MKNRPYDVCNKGIVALNILVFLVLSLLGNTQSSLFMYHHGAMEPEAVRSYGEWYRLFTAMFLHFDLRHLTNNMLMLFFLGEVLERAIGHVKYVLLYVLAGLGGNILSMAYMVRTGDLAVSGGASGAVFGVMGALIYIVLRNKGRLAYLRANRLIFMTALSLYYGFTATGVDNMAHVGGLLFGFLLALILYRKNSLPEVDIEARQ